MGMSKKDAPTFWAKYFFCFSGSLIVACLTIVLSSCNYTHSLVSSSVEDGDYYAYIRQNILDAKCMTCHYAGARQVDLSTYAALMNPKVIVNFQPNQSPLFNDISSGAMPKGGTPLSAGDIAIVKQWIVNGCPNSVVPPPPPPPPQPTWTWLSANVFGPKCVGCHSGASPKGDTDFSSYTNLINSQGSFTTPIVAGNAAQSGVYTEPSAQPQLMPPLPAPGLSTGELTAIFNWIQAGALNN